MLDGMCEVSGVARRHLQPVFALADGAMHVDDPGSSAISSGGRKVPRTWSYAVSSLRWDETSEKFVAPQAVIADATKQQRESVWHVLVSRRSYTFRLLQGGAEAVRNCKVVTPVVPLASTNYREWR